MYTTSITPATLEASVQGLSILPTTVPDLDTVELFIERAHSVVWGQARAVGVDPSDLVSYRILERAVLCLAIADVLVARNRGSGSDTATHYREQAKLALETLRLNSPAVKGDHTMPTQSATSVGSQIAHHNKCRTYHERSLVYRATRIG